MLLVLENNALSSHQELFAPKSVFDLGNGGRGVHVTILLHKSLILLHKMYTL
jgi:hypothetical protein